MRRKRSKSVIKHATTSSHFLLSFLSSSPPPSSVSLRQRNNSNLALRSLLATTQGPICVKESPQMLHLIILFSLRELHTQQGVEEFEALCHPLLPAVRRVAWCLKVTINHPPVIATHPFPTPPLRSRPLPSPSNSPLSLPLMIYLSKPADREKKTSM